MEGRMDTILTRRNRWRRGTGRETLAPWRPASQWRQTLAGHCTEFLVQTGAAGASSYDPNERQGVDHQEHARLTPSLDTQQTYHKL